MSYGGAREGCGRLVKRGLLRRGLFFVAEGILSDVDNRFFSRVLFFAFGIHLYGWRFNYIRDVAGF